VNRDLAGVDSAVGEADTNNVNLALNVWSLQVVLDKFAVSDVPKPLAANLFTDVHGIPLLHQSNQPQPRILASSPTLPKAVS
jgi:hypothetical protein